MPRFPTRTLVLMTLALFAFAWFWWQTHRLPPGHAVPVELHLVDGGSQ